MWTRKLLDPLLLQVEAANQALDRFHCFGRPAFSIEVVDDRRDGKGWSVKLFGRPVNAEQGLTGGRGSETNALPAGT